MTQLLFAVLILSADSTVQTGLPPNHAVVVFRGDFEGECDTNYDAWPDRWTRWRGRGYPTYIPIEIVDDDRPRSPGNKCLRIRMDGGAARVFTPPIAVSPHFSFGLDAFLRIDGLQHDVVSCSISFYDGEHKLLETYESELVRQASDWQPIHLGPLTLSSDRVRSAVLSVHVRPTDKADLSGSVFIDDLVLYRLPKMSVEMNSEHHVYSDPRDVNIACRVSGFLRDNPQIKFELLDIHGKVLGVGEQTMTGDPTVGRGKGSRVAATESSEFGFMGSANWRPEIPGPGFYKIRLSTPGYGRTVNVVVTPPLESGRQGEFGWSLPYGERPIGIKALPSLLSQAGVGWVKFPVWFGESDKQRAEDLAWFAERLGIHHVGLIGVLDQPPQALMSAFGSTQRMPVATLFEDKAVWYPALDPVFTRLSLKVRWWQLGRDDDTSFGSVADLETKIRAIRDAATSFGQQVNIGFPWRLLDEPPAAASPSWSFLSYVDALPCTGNEIRSYLDRDDVSVRDKWLVLQTLSPRNYDLETRIRDLVHSMLAAKIANAKGIFLADPFHSDHGVMHADGSPNELFLPWRTVAMLLGGADHIGSIKLPQGSENHVFVRDGQGVMVVWNNRRVTETTYLGNRVKLHDVWGHESTPTERTDGEFKEQEIPVGPMPTFVTGLDPAVALWRMQFQLQTTRLASIFGHEQSVSFRFQNTLPQAVAGRLIVHVPSSWKSQGTVRPFKVAANQYVQDAFRVALGPDASSGTQTLRVDFELTAERDIRFRLGETIEIGLGDVVVTLTSQLDEQGNLLVEQQLVNHTDKLVSFNCLLRVPDRRREKWQIFNLGQGLTTHTYVLPNGRGLIGKTLWLRAEEINGARILNEKIVAHE